jgi:cytidylate kinase
MKHSCGADVQNLKGIVFSGDLGSGKTTIAKEVARQLGWERYSIGDAWVEVYQRTHPQREISFSEFIYSRTSDENRAMNEFARTLLLRRRMVIESRYVNYLKEDPQIGQSCLAIYVSADISVRAVWTKAGGKQAGDSLGEITQMLKQRTEEEVRVGKAIFGIDFRDPAHYDMVLRSDAMVIPDKVATVMALIRGGADAAVGQIA